MLLVFGSINLDLSFRAPRLPAPGETVLGRGFHATPGGKGANQAHAARLQGVAVCMAGAVGRDAFADEALQKLRASGVDLSAVRAVESPTGCAGIVVDAEGENQIVVAPGANLAARAADVDDTLLARARVLLLQMETPPAENLALLRRARARGCLTVLNNAPAQALGADVLALLDVLVVNETELAETARGAGIREGGVEPALRQLADRFGLAAVLTQGGEGAVACVEGALLRAPAFPVKVVDTTGAGDTFTGVLAATLMQTVTDAGGNAPPSDSWPAALRRASAAAALACTRPGAQAAQPTRAETDALVQTS